MRSEGLGTSISSLFGSNNDAVESTMFQDIEDPKIGVPL